MTNTLENEVPGMLTAGYTRHDTPAMKAANDYADLHANPQAKTTAGHSTSTSI